MLKITPEIESLFLEKITQYLMQGRTTTTIKKGYKRQSKQINLGLLEGEIDFKPCERCVTYEEITNIKQEPTPDYVMQLIVNSMSVDKAIEFLTMKGFLVIDPSIVNENKANQGLSEEVVQEIRKKLLGIE